jgi:hypothetical protein
MRVRACSSTHLLSLLSLSLSHIFSLFSIISLSLSYTHTHTHTHTHTQIRSLSSLSLSLSLSLSNTQTLSLPSPISKLTSILRPLVSGYFLNALNFGSLNGDRRRMQLGVDQNAIGKYFLDGLGLHAALAIREHSPRLMRVKCPRCTFC